MKYKLKATKERKEKPSSQSLLPEGGHTEETLNCMFDPKEQSKYRNDILESKIKDIYNKYEKSLKVDTNKKSSMQNSPGVKNQSPTVKR